MATPPKTAPDSPSNPSSNSGGSSKKLPVNVKGEESKHPLGASTGFQKSRKKEPDVDEEVIDAAFELLDEMTAAERAKTLQDALATYCVSCGEETNEEGDCETEGCDSDDEEEDEEDEHDGTPGEDGLDDDESGDTEGNDGGEPAP